MPLLFTCPKHLNPKSVNLNIFFPRLNFLSKSLGSLLSTKLVGVDSFITNSKKLQPKKQNSDYSKSRFFQGNLEFFFPRFFFFWKSFFIPTTYRRGFVHYTMGQLKAVAETFYKLKLEIEVMDQEVKFDTVHVSFKLSFDNKVTDRSNSG